MSNLISIKFEGKNSISEIQKKFNKELSQKEILKTTAHTLNEVSNRLQKFLIKQIKKEYTISEKYIERLGSKYDREKATPKKLFVSTNFRYKPMPLIAFKWSGKFSTKDNWNEGVGVEVKKGKSMYFKHAVLLNMKTKPSRDTGEVSRHIGIFGKGRYIGKKFVSDGSRTRTGKTRLSEFKSVSAFTMVTSKEMQPKIIQYIDNTLPKRMQHNLQRKLDRMTK